jgi:hypothetical protein
MKQIIYATVAVLYLWFMVIFVPGNEPFGLSPVDWGIAWLTPLGLIFLVVATLVGVGLYRRINLS